MHEIDISNWDCILIFICSISLTGKIPKRENRNSPMDRIWFILTARYQTLETVSDLKSSTQPNFSSRPTTSKNIKTYQTNIQSSCKLCSSQQHSLRNCPKFLRMSIEERFNFVKKQKFMYKLLFERPWSQKL